MSPTKQPQPPRDTGLRIHRILQWASTISTTAIAGLIISGFSTWEKLKEQSVRMETVPGDVRTIKDNSAEMVRRMDKQEYRLDNLFLRVENVEDRLPHH